MSSSEMRVSVRTRTYSTLLVPVNTGHVYHPVSDDSRTLSTLPSREELLLVVLVVLVVLAELLNDPGKPRFR